VKLSASSSSMSSSCWKQGMKTVGNSYQKVCQPCTHCEFSELSRSDIIYFTNCSSIILQQYGNKMWAKAAFICSSQCAHLPDIHHHSASACCFIPHFTNYMSSSVNRVVSCNIKMVSVMSGGHLVNQLNGAWCAVCRICILKID